MNNPTKHALDLKKTQGIDKALKVAEDCKLLSEMLLKAEDVPAFSEEIEISTEEYKDKNGVVRERERIKIDTFAQLKRMKKTAIFWANVHGVLSHEKNKKTAPKTA